MIETETTGSTLIESPITVSPEVKNDGSEDRVSEPEDDDPAVRIKIAEQIATIREELKHLYTTGQNNVDTIVPLEEKLTQLLQQQRTIENTQQTQALVDKTNPFKMPTWLREMFKEIQNGFKELKKDMTAGSMLRKMQKDQGIPPTSRWKIFTKMKPSDIQNQITTLQGTKTQTAPQTRSGPQS